MTPTEIIARAIGNADLIVPGREGDRPSSAAIAGFVMSTLTAAGLVVVPVEPTEAMWTAGRDPVLARDSGSADHVIQEGYLNAPDWFDAEKDMMPTTGKVTKGTLAVWVWRAMVKAWTKEQQP